MLKKVLPFLIFLTMTLAACKPSSATAPVMPAGPAMEGCKVAALLPTPDPTLLKTIPAAVDTEHIRGSKDAKITIIEYSDFTCPYCAELAPVLKQLVEKYPQDVRVVYRHFILTPSAISQVGLAAIEAAGIQNKSTEMSDLVTKDKSWGSLSEADAQKWMADQAKTLGLDVEKFKTDLTSQAVKDTVDKQNVHKNSLIGAYAAEAAGLQGKFIEMYDILYANQDKWVGLTSEAALSWVYDQAKTLGLNVDKFKFDLTSDPVKEIVAKDHKQAEDAKLPGTPFLFINGLPYNSQMDITTMTGIIDLFKLEARTYKSCPPMVIDPKKQYEATLKTEKGDIVINLFADKAPLAVNSFVFLAQQGWFNNVTFHRVLTDFVAQAGDPSGSGFGGPGYEFKNENTSALFDKAGLVAMANGGPDTNGSQFFITYAAATSLNGGYTIFGEVASGMDVVKKLTPRDPQQTGSLIPGDKILSVTITSK
jgi:cyclophilin family peptidyl-prolyl cis-trans isomerase/protein-disulfide isomerase